MLSRSLDAASLCRISKHALSCLCTEDEIKHPDLSHLWGQVGSAACWPLKPHPDQLPTLAALQTHGQQSELEPCLPGPPSAGWLLACWPLLFLPDSVSMSSPPKDLPLPPDPKEPSPDLPTPFGFLQSNLTSGDTLSVRSLVCRPSFSPTQV